MVSSMKETGEAKKPDMREFGMSVVVNRKDLITVLEKLRSVVPKYSPKAILQCVKIETCGEDEDYGIAVTGDNLNERLRLQVSQVTSERDGVALPRHEDLLKVCKAIKTDVVTMRFDDAKGERLMVTGGKTALIIPSMDGSKFPIGWRGGDKEAGWPSSWKHAATWRVDMPEFEETLERVKPCMAREVTRYAICGVLWEIVNGEMFAVATDGRRLAVEKVEGARWRCKGEAPGSEVRFVMGMSLLKVLKAVRKGAAAEGMKVKMWGEDGEIGIPKRVVRVPKMLRMSGTDWVLWARPEEGNFPMWQDVVPETEGEDWSCCELSRESLLEAIETTKAARTEEGRGFAFEAVPEDDELRIRGGKSFDTECRLRVKVRYEGPTCGARVGLDPLLLEAPLRALGNGLVCLRILTKYRPETETDDDPKGVIMDSTKPVVVTSPSLAGRHWFVCMPCNLR